MVRPVVVTIALGLATAAAATAAAADPAVRCPRGRKPFHQDRHDHSDAWLVVSGVLDSCTRGGVLDGPAVVTSRDGTVIARGRYARGKRVGRWERRFATGELSEELVYQAGVPDGAYRDLLTNGNLSETGMYRHGIKVGVWTEYVGGVVSNTIDYDQLHAPALTCESGTTEQRERLPGAEGTEAHWCARSDGTKHGPFAVYGLLEDQPRVIARYRDGVLEWEDDG